MKFETILKKIVLIFIIGLLIVPSINAINFHLTDFKEEISENIFEDNGQEEIITFIYGDFIFSDFVFIGIYLNVELSAGFGTRMHIISYTSLFPPQKYIVHGLYYVKASIFIGYIAGILKPRAGRVFGIALGDIQWY